MVSLQREFKMTADNYEYLKQKEYEASTAIAANVSDVKIIEKAKDVGQGPISPRPLFNYLNCGHVKFRSTIILYNYKRGS